MKELIQKLREEIEELRGQISIKLRAIDELYASCKHSWMEPVFNIKKINYDCGSYGGQYDHREWQRECKVCGKIEITIKENLVSVPDFETQNVKITIPHLDWKLAQQHSSE